MKTRYMQPGIIITIAFLLFIGIDCKKDNPPVAPPDGGPDTTSHNFTFTQYTFGGQGGSSYFKDIAIVSDNDIWAVGAIYTDSGFYNAVHWDGEQWKLQKISVLYKGNSITPPLVGIFSFSATDIWVSSGVPAHYDGNSWIQYHLFDMGVLSSSDGSVNKIWGTGSSNFYIVGNRGTIVHFSNGVWTKLESGTTIDLRDVWGSSDPKGAGGTTVWACGYSNDNSQSALLNYNGTNWKTIWTEGTITTPPYGDLITSLWGDTNLIVSSNIGIYRQNINGNDTAKQTLMLNHFPYRVRGSAENNVVVVGDFAMIWHWNGADWKLLNETSPDQPLYSAAISTNMIVATGSDYSTFPNAALVYRGKRN